MNPLAEGLMLTVLTGTLWCGVGICYSRAAGFGDRWNSFMLLSSLMFIGFAWTVGMPSPARVPDVMAVGGLLFGGGLAQQFGFFAMRRAMERGPHGVAWCVGQSALVAPLLGGVLCFGEKLSLLQWTGCLLVLASLGFFAGNDPAAVSRRRGYVPWMLLCFLGLGTQLLSSILPNHFFATDNPALSWRVPMMSLSGLVWLIPMLRENTSLRSRLGGWKLAILCGAANLGGESVLFMALDRMEKLQKIALVCPIALILSIAMFFGYGVLVRREKPGLRERIGTGLALGGILLLLFT